MSKKQDVRTIVMILVSENWRTHRAIGTISKLTALQSNTLSTTEQPNRLIDLGTLKGKNTTSAGGVGNLGNTAGVGDLGKTAGVGTLGKTAGVGDLGKTAGGVTDVGNVADKVDVGNVADKVDVGNVADKVDVGTVADKVKVTEVGKGVPAVDKVNLKDPTKVAKKVNLGNVGDTADIGKTTGVDLGSVTKKGGKGKKKDSGEEMNTPPNIGTTLPNNPPKDNENTLPVENNLPNTPEKTPRKNPISISKPPTVENNLPNTPEKTPRKNVLNIPPPPTEENNLPNTPEKTPRKNVLNLPPPPAVETNTPDIPEQTPRKNVINILLPPSTVGNNQLIETAVNPTENCPEDGDPFDNATLSSVGGLESQIETLKQFIITGLSNKNPEFVGTVRVKPSKGIILYGLPGMGKTLLARAVGNDIGNFVVEPISFYHSRGRGFYSMWVGFSAAKLRKLFKLAISSKPSIIFLDKLEGLCPNWDNGETSVPACITLQAQLDTLPEGVVFVGAADTLAALDPKIQQPGRFDTQLQVPEPDRASRKKILEIEIAKWKISRKPDDKELESFINRTEGYSRADIESFCQQAEVVYGAREPRAVA